MISQKILEEAKTLVGGDRQEQAQYSMSALHFFTDSGGQFVRDKAHFIDL